MIALLAIGIAGLIATAALGISTTRSARTLNQVRILLSACGIIGAIGMGAIAFGVFPFGHYDRPSTTGTGLNGTDGGIMTQSSKSAPGQ